MRHTLFLLQLEMGRYMIYMYRYIASKISRYSDTLRYSTICISWFWPMNIALLKYKNFINQSLNSNCMHDIDSI